MRAKNVAILLILLSLSLVFAGCPAEPSGSDTARMQEPDMADDAPAEPEDLAVSEEKKSSEPVANRQALNANTAATADSEGVPIPQKRMIQRDGRFVLESSNPVKVQETIEKATKDAGGFVIQANRRSNAGEIRGVQTVSMTLRIPAEKFDGSLGKIREAAERVVVEEIKGTDVTEKYVDIQARLKAKKALEEQFLTIMKQAKNVQDALNVQRQLANVRSEIERIEGQKRLLESLTSMSTIRITINPPNSVTSSGSGFWYQLQDAISDGFEAALTFILVLVRVAIAVIPFLVIFVLPVALIARWLWNRIKRNRKAREILRESEDRVDESE